jgi:hypothetical protein
MPLNLNLPPMSATGKMPVPQRVNFSCGMGILPVHKKLIENGAISQFKLTFCTNVSNRQDACSTKSKFSCGTGILPVHKRLVENGARSQFKPMPNAQFPIPHSLFPIENPKPEKVSRLPFAPPKQLK